MSSSLTPYSVHRIIYFVENDNRTGQVTETLDWRVNRTWSSVYHDFSVLFGALRVPADYVRSLEYALHLQDGSDNAARLLRNVFRNGTPLVIDQCLPPLIVPKIIETFQRLEEEPSVLEVTLSESTEAACTPHGAPLDLSKLWPKVYVNHFPCGVCSKVDAFDEADKELRNKRVPHAHPAVCCYCRGNYHAQEGYVVEKFHFRTKHFDKQLTVELYFVLYAPVATPSPVAPLTVNRKGELQKVVIRLDDFSCGGPPSGTVRSGQSVSLLPQFASDVYGFLDRAHVGTSLVANRGLSELILKLNHLLPVHHLTCEFKNDAAVSPYTAQYY